MAQAFQQLFGNTACTLVLTGHARRFPAAARRPRQVAWHRLARCLVDHTHQVFLVHLRVFANDLPRHTPVLGQHQQAHRVDIGAARRRQPGCGGKAVAAGVLAPVGAGIDQRHGGRVTILGLPAATQPIGLFSKMVTLLHKPWAILSTSMRSAAVTCSPMGATSPLTLTSRAIQSSASRREHNPTRPCACSSAGIAHQPTQALPPAAGRGQRRRAAGGRCGCAGVNRPPHRQTRCGSTWGRWRARAAAAGRAPAAAGRAEALDGAGAAGAGSRRGGAAQHGPRGSALSRRGGTGGALGWTGTG